MGGNSETTWSQTDVPAGTWTTWPPRLSMPMTNRLPVDSLALTGTRSVVVNRFQAEVRPCTSALANVWDPSGVSRLTVSGPLKSPLALAKKDTRQARPGTTGTPK